MSEGVMDACGSIFINKYAEGYSNRRYYGGYIGPVDAWGNYDYFVNLRSMEFDSERYCIYVGSGLTADSDAEKEWQETVQKAKTLQRFL